MTFFFFFFGFCFYYFSFNTVLTWKIVGVSKVSVIYIYIYIDYILEHPISITHPIQTGFYRVSLPFIKLHDQQGQERE